MTERLLLLFFFHFQKHGSFIEQHSALPQYQERSNLL